MLIFNTRWILVGVLLWAAAEWRPSHGQSPWGKSVLSSAPGGGPSVREAFQHFKAEDYDAAAKSLKSIVDDDVEMPPSQVIMSQWFSQSNRPGLARRALERAVSDEPSDPEAYVLLSDVALREGRLAEAELLCFRAYNLLESFKRSLRRKEVLQRRGLANLALVCELREDWSGAEKYLRAWLASDPDAATAMHRLGQVLFRRGREEEALEHLRTASKLDQNLPIPEVIRGRLYEESGKHQQAVQSMAAAVQAAPLDLRTRLAVAQWALETGQYAEAQKQAQAAAQVRPDSTEVRQLAGLVALFRRDYPAAALAFEAVLKQSPGSFSAQNNLAIALAEQNDAVKRRRALEQAEDNVFRSPHHPDAYSTLGWVLYRLGRSEEAERALRTSGSTGIVSPDTSYFLARLAADKGDKPAARKMLQAALSSKSACLFRQEAQELLTQLR